MTKGKTFKYEHVHSVLAERIRSGTYENGFLPSEKELMKEFSAGRNIIRQAMDMLAEEHLIGKKRGLRSRLLRRNWNGNLLLLQNLITDPRDINPVYAAETGQLLKTVSERKISMDILYLPPDDAAEYEEKVAGAIHKAAGVFVHLFFPGALSTRIADMLREHPRVISMDCARGSAGKAFVGTDNFEGGRLAAHLLAEAGRKNIVFIGFSEAFFRYTPMQERLSGFMRGCMECELPFSIEKAVFNFEAHSSVQMYASLQKILEKYPDTDGIFCITDYVMDAFLHVLQEQGKRVPEDISVVGFDGLTPNFTSVIQPCADIADRALELMLHFIDHQLPAEGIYLVEPSVQYGSTCYFHTNGSSPLLRERKSCCT